MNSVITTTLTTLTRNHVQLEPTLPSILATSILTTSIQPTATIPEAEPTITSGVVNDLLHGIIAAGHSPRYSELAKVYCLADHCSKSRDWLLFQPTAIPLWTLGAMAITLGLVASIKYRTHEYFRLVFVNSVNTILALGISMLLRAAITLLSGSLVALYAASMFFNLCAGLFAYVALCKGAVNLVTLFQPMTHREKLGFRAWRIVFHFCPIVLVACGVALMFHTSLRSYAGMRCIQAVLVLILAITLLISVAFVLRLRNMRGHMRRRTVFSSFVVCVLLGLWGSFMLARTFVSVDSPARKSETMFFLLNYLPIILICLVSMVFGEPLTDRDYCVIKATMKNKNKSKGDV
ncbi:hypothetical protein GGI25_003151 [Coemansia spiralis]|uniref:Uncharacterized protein n=2 Tax=Coemansia TaxID=4863 RepID=A0A9W8G2L4_9FUNG|nr:hypothetical protein BX070DRAFT_230015 [Coemansia spiralis]KAJ1991734.1 hypothetical protein EDC05_003231 [Coemansia umbellata]KAJ2621761.1 hypothetical protein GGI26_003856 [Coemansia sp. RSA 1358]KAJ2677516.1 hypothetical protein GGI25_003151 [Coemansia spiralis]